MTRILFIAYHFPPVGGGSVQRSVRFTQLLPEHGYEPVVLTCPGPQLSRWTPEDTTLADEVSDVEVHRVDGPEPMESAGLEGTVDRWLRRRQQWTRWWWSQVEGHGLRLAAST